MVSVLNLTVVSVQTVVSVLNLLPGFKPLPGSLFKEKRDPMKRMEERESRRRGP